MMFLGHESTSSTPSPPLPLNTYHSSHSTPSPSLSSCPQISAVIIDDLPLSLGETDLLLLLQQCGRVHSINTNRHSHKNALYSVVEFSAPEHAEQARLQLDGQFVFGALIRVFPYTIPQHHSSRDHHGGHGGRSARNVRTAQVHISYLSKQLDLLIDEHFIRDIFSNFGEVLEVSLKKVSVDVEMCIQNGYGFVHFPLSAEGVKSALHAAEALHQVTINQISYDCSASNQLRQLLSQMDRDPALRAQVLLRSSSSLSSSCSSANTSAAASLSSSSLSSSSYDAHGFPSLSLSLARGGSPMPQSGLHTQRGPIGGGYPLSHSRNNSFSRSPPPPGGLPISSAAPWLARHGQHHKTQHGGAQGLYAHSQGYAAQGQCALGIATQEQRPWAQSKAGTTPSLFLSPSLSLLDESLSPREYALLVPRPHPLVGPLSLPLALSLSASPPLGGLGLGEGERDLSLSALGERECDSERERESALLIELSIDEQLEALWFNA